MPVLSIDTRGTFVDPDEPNVSTGSGSGSGGSGGGSGGSSSSSSSSAAAPAVPTLSILSSATMQWFFDPDNGKWYAAYQLPAGAGTMLFEADETQMDAIFGEDKRPKFSEFDSNSAIAGDQYIFGGGIAELEGKGVWEEEVDRVISLALDTKTLPDWIKDDQAALSLLFVAVSEDRTDEWFYDQLSTLDSFKARFPGLEALTGMGLTTLEAVRAFTEFETQLKTMHAAAGFSSDAITADMVGGLLTKGYSIEQVGESYGIWKRMNDFAPALEAFNEVLVASGQQALSGDKMYDFLAGNAPIELYNLYEASSITEAAEAAGFGDVFGAEDALTLAMETTQDLTLNQAYETFTTVAQQALRLRAQLNVEEYGLSVDDLIDLSFSRAPRSGKTAAEVGEILARITQQAQGFLQDRVNPFFGFSETGKPKALSLGELNLESA